MSKEAKLAKIRAMLSESSSGRDLFTLEPNRYALFIVHLYEDEGVIFWLSRTPDGKRYITEDPDYELSLGNRVSRRHALPVYCKPGGWKVLVGSTDARGLLGQILTLLEATGDPDTVIYVARTGSGLETRYAVHPAIVVKPEEAKALTEEYKNAPPPPTVQQVWEVVRRVFAKKKEETYDEEV